MDAEQNLVGTRLDRQNEIFNHVLLFGSVTYAELIKITGKSLMTVHRDIDDLVAQGLLRKFHGGASVLPTSVFESSSHFRMLRNVNEKNALAKKALEFIEPGMSVLLDDSTSAYFLAKQFVGFGPLTVLSNYRPTINLLIENQDINVIGIGGSFSKTHDSFIGPANESGLLSYSIDIAFMSTSAIKGFMTYHQEQDIVLMKRDMMTSANRRILLMDNKKVGETSLHRLAPVSEFTDVIFNADVNKDMAGEISEYTKVHFANIAQGEQN